MLRDFFKRRKRVKNDELSSSTLSGQYIQTDNLSRDDDRRRSDERWYSRENVVNGSMRGLSTGGSLFNITELFERKRCLSNPLNTLRRSKHKDSDVTKRNDSIGPNTKTKNVGKPDLYRSSPSLLGPELRIKMINNRRSEGDKYFPKRLETGSDVLHYTNWDTFGSLITLNFGEDDRMVKTELTRTESLSQVQEGHSFQSRFLNRNSIIQSDCESNIYEEFSENEDSGTFCDSDSGISSLYETLMKYQTLPGNSCNRNSFVWQQTIEETDLELCENNTASVSYLEKLRIDHKLIHIFQRNYKLIYASQAFEMEFDILTKVPVSSSSQATGQESVTEIKQAMLKMVTEQQQCLGTMMARRRSEKEEVEDSINQFVDFLITGANNNTSKKFNRYIDQIDPVVNLVFGLELKTAYLSNNNKSMEFLECRKNRLGEALVIKERHNDIFNMLVSHFETKNQLLFTKKIRLKQKIICEIRLLQQELHYLEMQLKILFIY